MPVVKVRIYAGLRLKLGWREKELEIEKGLTVKELLDRIPEVGGEIYSYMSRGYNPVILVNGVNIFLKDGLNTAINNGDIIDIFPPSAGGTYILEAPFAVFAV